MILDENHHLLLRAALGKGATAVEAYKEWRKRVPLNDISYGAFRVLANVVDTARQHSIEDPDMPRMKGVLKHTWLSNMFRLKSLQAMLATLEQVGIEAIVLKSGALFARYPDLATFLAAGDFDVLVRRDDAQPAIEKLLRAGFRGKHGVHLAAFTSSDFDRLHSCPMVQHQREEEIDLHWRPLPQRTDDMLVEQLFERSQHGTLGGVQIKIPELADHLFLCLARPERGDIAETFARIVEAAHAVRSSNGEIYWDRLIRLCRRYGCAAQAAEMLGVIDADLEARIPKHVFSSLRERSFFSLANVFEKVGLGKRVQARPGDVSYKAKADSLRGATARQTWLNFVDPSPGFAPGVDFPVGFSYPEDTGRWTESRNAIITAEIGGFASQVAVRVALSPLSIGGRGATMFELCSGRDIWMDKAIRQSDELPFRCTVAAEVIAAGGRRWIALAFRILNPASPRGLGLSADSRELGLFVHGVEILPEAESSTSPCSPEDVSAGEDSRFLMRLEQHQSDDAFGLLRFAGLP